MKRGLVPLLPLLCLLFGCTSGGSDDRTPPVISGVQVSPSVLLYEGQVQTSVQASDDVAIDEVLVIAEGPTTVTASLAPSGGGTYQGQVSLPLNDTGDEVVYQVIVEAKDTSEKTTRSAPVSVIVDSPPAPP